MEKEKHFHRLRLLLLFFLLLGTLGSSLLYYIRIRRDSTLKEERESFQYYFSMITMHPNDPFWNQVLEGAREEAEKENAYVDAIGQSFPEGMSEREILDMAYYAQSDGILLYPEDAAEIETEIENIVEAGIPVITMDKDSPDSGRQGFVGVNDYFLGQCYGTELKNRYNKEEDILVAVLFPGNSFTARSRSWFLQGLENTVSAENFHFLSKIIQEENGLSTAEEALNELLLGEEDGRAPDILLCLDYSVAENAYGILRDRGLSEQIKVIGYTSSDAILRGISEQGVLFTVTADPKEMGRRAVRELLRYRSYHVANYTTDVPLTVIDRDTLRERTEEGGEKDELP